MTIDWNKVWQEFNEELDDYLRSGKSNEWRVQQDMIRSAVERNLTTGAVDGATLCPKCGEPMKLMWVCETDFIHVSPRN